MAMKVVRLARLELSGGSTPDLLRPPLSCRVTCIRKRAFRATNAFDRIRNKGGLVVHYNPPNFPLGS